LPSSPRSSSNSSRALKSHLDYGASRPGSATHRQMALACTHGSHPQCCSRAHYGGVRSG
jgi:hypothetical protein